MKSSEVATSRGAELDMHGVFRELKHRWLSKKKGRNGTDLCKFLNIRKQLVSTYATGSDGKRAPWWAVMKLMKSLKLELRMTPDGAVLTRRRGQMSNPAHPALRKDDVVFEWRTKVSNTE